MDKEKIKTILDVLIDFAVIAYLLYGMVSGVVYWQDGFSQLKGWVDLVLLIWYCFLICVVEEEERLFTITKESWGYWVK